MTTIHALMQQRARLQLCADQIRAAIQDIEGFRKEGSDAAGYAAAWAAVMMATGILRTGLSAADRRAGLMFSALDKAVERADRVLKFFGGPQIGKKADLLASLDPNLRQVSTLTKDVREAQAFLRKHKVKPPKHLALVIDLALGMTDDTLLMLQAGELQSQVGQHTGAALNQSLAHLRRVNARLTQLDARILQAFDQRDLFNRTA